MPALAAQSTAESPSAVASNYLDKYGQIGFFEQEKSLPSLNEISFHDKSVQNRDIPCESRCFTLLRQVLIAFL